MAGNISADTITAILGGGVVSGIGFLPTGGVEPGLGARSRRILGGLLLCHRCVLLDVYLQPVLHESAGGRGAGQLRAILPRRFPG